MAGYCYKCGKPIEFRTNELGHSYPVHLDGGCSADATGPPSHDWPSTVCAPTRCPICGDEVFFIRHNGGCAWFDELGQPWPKHGCMEHAEWAKWCQPREAMSPYPPSNMDGTVVKIWPVSGGSKHFVVRWDTALAGVFSLPYAGFRLKTGSRVRYRTIDAPYLSTSSGRQLLVDPVTRSSIQQLQLGELLELLDRSPRGGKANHKLLNRSRDNREVWVGNLGERSSANKRLRVALVKLGFTVESVRVKGTESSAYAFIRLSTLSQRRRLLLEIGHLDIGGRSCPVRSSNHR